MSISSGVVGSTCGVGSSGTTTGASGVGLSGTTTGTTGPPGTTGSGVGGVGVGSGVGVGVGAVNDPLIVTFCAGIVNVPVLLHPLNV